MRQFIADVRSRTQSEEGATAAEYVFLLVFIAIVAAVGITALGTNLNTLFGETATTVGGQSGSIGGDGSDDGSGT